MPFNLSLSRRAILSLVGGGVAFMAGARPVSAVERRIGQLIEQAHGKGTISERIHFISGALRGTRYQGYTLIGGPRRPEKLVMRDDAFDCVTFCETVLAAAIAASGSEFDSVLRTIRYHDGVVVWRERNHYFFEWSRRNVENRICSDIAMDGSVEIKKTVDTQKGLEKRRFSMRVIPSSIFLANKGKLENGDIVGFVTRRPNLDYFHIGFVAFAGGGEMLLRHASLSRHRVLDERMDHFVAANRVRYVTLLRPQEPHAVAMNKS